MIRPVFAFMVMFLMLTACNEDGGNPDAFDRTALLSFYANDMIIPAYDALGAELVAFNQAVDAFVQNPAEATLDSARQAWLSAALRWQNANAYNFGPAGEAGLVKGLIEELGTFPAAQSKIEAAVASGQWNFQDFNRDARGLPAMEYLLFAGQPAETVAQFQAEPNRGQYLKAAAADAAGRVQAVRQSWQGAYLADFLSRNGTDAGSATSQLYNEFVRSFEALKNFKLGLPMGKRPGQVQTEPQLVEAPYSAQSLALAREHFRAVADIWRGAGGGPSLRDYLLTVEGGQALADETEVRIAAVNAAFDQLPPGQSLAGLIQAGNAELEILYTEIQKLTRYFKSDMSSLLGIAITFSSGDGD